MSETQREAMTDPVELKRLTQHVAEIAAETFSETDKEILHEAVDYLRQFSDMLTVQPRAPHVPLLDEYYPLSLKPLENPNHDPGEHQVLDRETAHIFRIGGSRERAEAIVATLNAAPATASFDATARMEKMLLYCDWLFERLIKFPEIDAKIEGVGLLKQHVTNVRAALATHQPNQRGERE